MRLFVALIPPAPAVEDLDEFLAPRREAGRHLRWSASDQWHVTLAFMAEARERHLDDLVERLGAAAARRTPLEMSLAGGGAFPDPSRAKVLYTRPLADDPVELDRMAAGARTAAATAGIEVDGAQFTPHVTLARMNRPIEATRWLRVLEAYRGPVWTADSITLIASHLGQGPRRRPRYDVLEEFPLGNTTAAR